VKKLTALAVGVVAMVAVSASAFAAPPVAAPVWNWNGWYAGLNIGGSFGNATSTVTFAGIPIATGSQQLDGVIGGGQAGYNWTSGSTLVGLEADIQGSSESFNNPDMGLRAVGAGLPFNGVILPAVTGILGVSEKLSWFGTLRGRLGLLAGPTSLFYVTGGLAYGEVQTSETMTVGAGILTGNSFNTTRTGWTLGGGAEGVIATNWTAKIEYLYIDLGNFSNMWAAATPTGFTPVGFSTHVTDNIIRVGVNYHFH
jgi:outer membrane immunogenic protein